MDEPFGALDPQTRMDMQDLLVKLWREVQATVFFVTHSIDEAVFLGDRVYVMGRSPGTILEEMKVEPADRPARLMQREPRFIETVNHLRDMISRLEEAENDADGMTWRVGRAVRARVTETLPTDNCRYCLREIPQSGLF